jgi:hypothetical protein
MSETEFWRDLKPITSVFKADALPEVSLADAPTEDERYAQAGMGAEYVESLFR